ncbi:MAG: 4,5-DOPA dioxygenase extradiol [Chitinophagales bacterium]|nr:4,5-DOPA dioxygenase extradiol [Chitinophagales bacterium]
MQRRTFIKNSTFFFTAMNLNQFKDQYQKYDDAIMPALFVGHGNPMNAIEQNEFSTTWEKIGRQLPVPKAILCVSAHWETKGTKVTAMERPQTIHDFYGFPKELFDVEYDAPGAPELAKQITESVKQRKIELDHEWGLDHGCWSVLHRMFPAATIPTFQLSLDHTASPQQHYDLAKELKELRKKGVLIFGSGNMVHNLRLFQMKDTAYDWAIEFDQTLKTLIEKGDHQSVIHYDQLGKAAQLAIPTNEHYLPLLYSLALQDPKDDLQFFNDKTTAGSISMRSLILSNS